MFGKILFSYHDQLVIIWSFILKIPLSILAYLLTPTLPSKYLLLGCLIHTPVSIVYHVHKIHKTIYVSALNKADYAFINAMIMFTTYAIGYYTLPNEYHRMQQIYYCSIASILNTMYACSSFYKKDRLVRTFLVGSVIVIAVYPVFYSVYVNGFFLAKWGVFSCLSYILSGLVWISRFPERFSPSCLFNSHALMHICIVFSHLSFYMFIAQSAKV